MRTLITGINGFLARRLSSYAFDCDSPYDLFGIYRELNHKSEYKNGLATRLQADINNLDSLKRIISDYEIELIYHCAAQSIVRIANTNPLYCLQNNVIGTANVLEAVRQVNQKIKVV